MSATAILIEDPLFLAHKARGHHPERPERLEAAHLAIEESGREVDWIRLPARDATQDELARVHHEAYLNELGQMAGKSGLLDADTFVSPQSVAAARRAAGASATLVEGLLERTARWGVLLSRPPGHHARPGAAMGFCLLNNVAVAAAHARARGVERVLVLDWDVHHGNGTQEIFYSQPDVLYVSLHQFPYYPGTGEAAERGHADGRGYTVNVPLSSGAHDAVYRAAFERIICPIIEQYRPGLTLISAGFDAHFRDPLGGMALNDASYYALSRQLLSVLAPDHPIGLLLEGGYDLEGLHGALRATVDAFAGVHREVGAPGPIESEHSRDLERAELAQRNQWLLG
jgi:acetoin utilization deacetylase AcuC-like enzyme